MRFKVAKTYININIYLYVYIYPGKNLSKQCCTFPHILLQWGKKLQQKVIFAPSPFPLHCSKSSEIQYVEENEIIHGIFREVSRFPRYISCYTYLRKSITFGTVYTSTDTNWNKSIKWWPLQKVETNLCDSWQPAAKQCYLLLCWVSKQPYIFFTLIMYMLGGPSSDPPITR